MFHSRGRTRQPVLGAETALRHVYPVRLALFPPLPSGSATFAPGLGQPRSRPYANPTLAPWKALNGRPHAGRALGGVPTTSVGAVSSRIPADALPAILERREPRADAL